MRDRIASWKSRFMRGSSYLAILLSIFSVVGLAKLLGVNVSVIILSTLGIIAYLGGCYFVGWIDETWGIWKHEMNYQLKVQPKGEEMYNKINFIYEKLGGK